jgi:hypothetical protein
MKTSKKNLEKNSCSGGKERAERYSSKLKSYRIAVNALYFERIEKGFWWKIK